MAARHFENLAFPGETRQVAIDTKAAATPPPVHSAHQGRRRDAAVLCQLVGCRKAEWVAGENAGLRALAFRALAGSELRATRAKPAQRKPCYTFPFAVETLLATSSRQRQAAGGVKRRRSLCLYGSISRRFLHAPFLPGFFRPHRYCPSRRCPGQASLHVRRHDAAEARG